MIVPDLSQQIAQLTRIDQNIERAQARIAELEDTARTIPQGHVEEANSKTLLAALRAARLVLEEPRRSIIASGALCRPTGAATAGGHGCPGVQPLVRAPVRHRYGSTVMERTCHGNP
ncbi:hypothetical protein [Eleftheria terrae]|uniref:hypothetical protein n=1 Tax=Eleftheria terrae TaxID=1597781 RepID=UPI00263AEEB4|nr:hypothetical protein [Eleftheria terrae]WKB54365.1 hypothetical protein N7L95_08255 [Eleftheria terrae]